MASSLRVHLWISCVVVTVEYIAVAKTQCYYPGGAWAKDQFSCDKHAHTTLCCPTGWTCFSNNLCIATDPNVVSSDLPAGTAIRGSCTNPLWNNTACGDFCLNDPISSNNGSVVPCGDNTWCCQPDSADGRCNCDSGAGTFQVSDGTAQTVIGVVGLQHTSTGDLVLLSSTEKASPSSSTAMSIVSAVPTVSMVSSASASASSSPLSSTSASSPSSASASSTSSMTPFRTSASSSKISSMTASIPSASSTTTTGSASAASKTDQQSSESPGIPVTQTTAFKAGIGVAAGIALVATTSFIIWFIIQRRRTRPAPHRNTSIGANWQNPITSTTPFQIPPTPHPYGDTQSSTSASRTALADQIAHNRTTPRPFEIIEENNPYADRYVAGGLGR